MDGQRMEGILPFPLFHGTSDAFLPSICSHGLGGRDIIADWRVLDFLRTGITILTGYVDLTNPETALNWMIIKAAASQRVDHFNWRHGSTYLIAAQFRAVMYAMNPFGSELMFLVSQLIEMCPQECRSAIDKLLAHYSELSECLSAKYKPIIIRADNVRASSLLTEKGEDARGLVAELIKMLAEGKLPFSGISQMANFELREPLEVGKLQLFYVCDATGTDYGSTYRLERISI